MYKVREITRMSEGCEIMSGTPDKWIGWAIDTVSRDNLLICNSDGDPIWAGEHWKDFRWALDLLVCGGYNAWDNCRMRAELSNIGSRFVGSGADVLICNRDHYDDLYGHSTGAALWHIAGDMGEDVTITPILDARGTEDDITLYYLGSGPLPGVVWDIEAYYYDYLTELVIDDGSYITCVPTYIVDDTELPLVTAVENYLRLVGTLDDDEILVERPAGGYSIDDLIGTTSVHNAVKNFIEFVDSDMGLDSDVIYTFGEFIYNLKEGGYRFDIDGNLLD